MRALSCHSHGIPGFLDERLDELVVNRTVNKQSRSAQADFPLVQEAGIHNGRDHLRQLGILVNDGGVFPSHLTRAPTPTPTPTEPIISLIQPL